VAITATYEALTRERAYRQAMTPMNASQELYVRRQSHFDERLVEKFIHVLGVYPPGCLVEINTGEIARVLTVNPENQLRPLLEIFTDAAGGEPSARRILDLADVKTKKLYVRRVLTQSDPRVPALLEG
jgi:hypothetical protein